MALRHVGPPRRASGSQKCRPHRLAGGGCRRRHWHHQSCLCRPQANTTVCHACLRNLPPQRPMPTTRARVPGSGLPCRRRMMHRPAAQPPPCLGPVRCWNRSQTRKGRSHLGAAGG
eukprot:366450-Chlamydomonas_euryale.AAC.11